MGAALHDYDALPSELEGDPLSEQQKQAARRTVAYLTSRAGGDAAVAAEVMMMLGCYPGQDDDEYLTGPVLLPGMADQKLP